MTSLTNNFKFDLTPRSILTTFVAGVCGSVILAGGTCAVSEVKKNVAHGYDKLSPAKMYGYERTDMFGNKKVTWYDPVTNKKIRGVKTAYRKGGCK